MAEAGSAEHTDPLKAVADAMEAAVEAAKDGAEGVRESVGGALPAATSVLVKAAYNTCYAVSYGVVFPSVLLARSIPQDNALVHGLIDGAHAARDMVAEMRARKDTEGPAPALAHEGEPPAVEPAAS